MSSLLEHTQNRKAEAPDPSDGLGNLACHKELLEEYLEDLVFSKDQRLAVIVEAMRYALLARGKRIRPILCMEVARTFGEEPAGVLPSAAAIELIHTFSLIHDDLPAMDDDDFRRGRPTVHKRYGEARAILTGDAFFGESLWLVTARQKGTAEQVLAVARELARATGVDGMVGGQLLDLDHTGRKIEPETLETMHACKTGALIRASARIGAILAGARGEDLVAISEYARQVGLCFQIVDDILDASATIEELGKSAGSDAAQGKATFVSVYGPDGARRLADDSLGQALRALERTEPDTRSLAGLARFVRRRVH